MLWQGGVVNTVVVLGSSGVGLDERRGGRNNKYNANISMTVHDKTSNGARGALMRYEVIPVKGKSSGKVSPVLRVFGQRDRRGKVASLIC